MRVWMRLGWFEGGWAVGETQNGPFQLSFNSSQRVAFQGSRVTPDGGLLVVRELDQRLSLSGLMQRHLSDSRQGKNIEFPCSVWCGSRYTADWRAGRMSTTPSGFPRIRPSGSSGRAGFGSAARPFERPSGQALTSRLQSFETEVLTRPENWAGLAALNRELMARAEAIAPRRRVVLDMDSPVLSEAEGTEVAVYGEQEQSAYNGHFEPTCYHPLLLFNGEGECLAVKLRPGNVASAEGWEELLPPEIDRLQAQGIEVAFRGDAAFARPGVYESVEARGARYVIRLPANGNLERKIAELPKRPAGRSSHKPVVRSKRFFYQAASWTKPRRVVAKSLP